jgi:apocytochrome f
LCSRVISISSFAQQNYSNPRAANGKLACANCHLIKKSNRSTTSCSSKLSFEVAIKVPYDVNKQQIGANGKS